MFFSLITKGDITQPYGFLGIKKQTAIKNPGRRAPGFLLEGAEGKPPATREKSY